MKDVYIVSAKRTPIGGFLGSLSQYTATQLGAFAIKGAMENIIHSSSVDSVYMGNVLSANLGQSPARQAAIFAGIHNKADATTVNKVCASGMKAVMLAALQIQTGSDDISVAGGMESMSNVPHYVYSRRGTKLGDLKFTDGLLKDGLTDVYNNYHMGCAAELCAKEHLLTRAMQDDYTLASYAKARNSNTKNYFANEIIPVSSGGVDIIYDEDVDKLIPEKVPKLKPVFDSDGTITAANASNLNDGAAALVLTSADALKKNNLKPAAKIRGFADAAQSPELFATSPSLAIPIALKRAGLKINDIDYFEINEAYAAVALANQKLLRINIVKLNVHGGAVALGHPIGASGARIIVTLLNVLKLRGSRFGVAAICNGGGGASAIVIENLEI